MKRFNDIKFKRKLLFYVYTHFYLSTGWFSVIFVSTKVITSSKRRIRSITGLKTMNIDSLVSNEIKKKKKKSNKYFIILTMKHFLLQYDCERQY